MGQGLLELKNDYQKMYPKVTDISNRSRKCKKCEHTHSLKLNCSSIRCLYCYNTHSIEELKDGICPQAYLATQQFRRKDTLVCLQCKGLGKYVSNELQTIKETEVDYKRRLIEWENDKKKDPSLQRPTKMKFKGCVTTKGVECQSCHQNGVIQKYIFCCFWGCKNCQFSRTKIHPDWERMKRQSKKQPVIVKQQSYCSICHEVIPVGSHTYPTDCGHQFHIKCIVNWFIMRQKSKVPITCPECRHPESFFPAEFYDPFIHPEKYNELKKFYHEDNILTKYQQNRSRAQRLKRPKPEAVQAANELAIQIKQEQVESISNLSLEPEESGERGAIERMRNRLRIQQSIENSQTFSVNRDESQNFSLSDVIARASQVNSRLREQNIFQMPRRRPNVAILRRTAPINSRITCGPAIQIEQNERSEY